MHWAREEMKELPHTRSIDVEVSNENSVMHIVGSTIQIAANEYGREVGADESSKEFVKKMFF